MGILIGNCQNFQGKVKHQSRASHGQTDGRCQSCASMRCFVWNWTSLYCPFNKGCGWLNQRFLPDLLLMTRWSRSPWAPGDCLPCMCVNMTRELPSLRWNWGAPWGRPSNVPNSKFMAKMWHLRGKQRSGSRPWRKLGLEVTYSPKLNISGNCSKLWPWNVLASRGIGVGRERWVPYCLLGSVPTALSGQAWGEGGRCGGEREEVKSPLCQARSPPLSLPLLLLSTLFLGPGEPLKWMWEY